MFSNFIFNGQSSKDFGVICVKFGTQSGEKITSGGNETELNIGKTPKSNDFYIIDQQYSNPLSFSFQIINTNQKSITSVEERMLNKWLLKRGQYFDFKIDDDRFRNIVFQVNISNPKLIEVGEVYGMEYTVTCKNSYGLTPTITKQFNVTSPNQEIRVYVDTDEDDYIYPDLVITKNTNGNLSITNAADVPNRVFTINNLVNNEIITINGSLPDIKTSVSSHAVWNDFSKYWIRLTDGVNILTVSSTCSISISFKEVRKVGINGI